MSATRYRNFFRLCEAWPLDPSKPGRDIAAVIRKRVAEAFKMGENTQISDVAKCDRSYESLQKLNTDFYKTKYQDKTATRTVGAAGLTYEQCHAVMASETLEELRQTEIGFFGKLKQTFTAERPN
ncbi:ubiquinol-cytochrome c reductase complex assembly factor 2-like [Babylonia areolata]|uniref:ubiquinol-cytochrome c reductase complex assembly factor 2-like n=1 Tax=Babylonia areolata TaxID=304850 RepID=UPI003FD1B51D